MDQVKDEILEVSDSEISDDGEAEDVDTNVPLLLKQVMSMVDKELIIYTTRLEQMKLPCQGHKMTLESIEKASKPILKQTNAVTVKTETLQSTENPEPCGSMQLDLMPIPFQDENIKQETVKTESLLSMENEPRCSIRYQDQNMKDQTDETSQENEYEPCGSMLLGNMPIPFQGHNTKEEMRNEDQEEPIQSLEMCKPLNVTLTDYRKYPVLSAKEIMRWDEYCKSQRHTSEEAELDHVVKIVHPRSGLAEVFHMSVLGILKRESGLIGSKFFKDVKKIPKLKEIIACCWYARNKYLREMYMQLESEVDVETEKTFKGLFVYLLHYVTLCGNHKCPPDGCKCCEYCKNHIWFRDRDILNQDLEQKVQDIYKLQNPCKPTKHAKTSLIVKAMAYANIDQKYKNKSNSQNVTKQNQLERTVKNELLEIRYVTKNTSDTVTVNKIKLLEIGHNGQIQLCIEKKKNELTVTGLVDENKKKTVHEVCCWCKLQQVIDTLKTTNFLPEVYHFIRQKHGCSLGLCRCCCYWRPGFISNVCDKPKPAANIPVKPTTNTGISVKPLNLLLNKPKPRPRRINIKKRKILTPTPPLFSKVNSNSPTVADYVHPPVSADQMMINNSNGNNMINVKKVFVPAGNPVSDHGVNSKLMQSIIDEEITRLIESNTMIPLTVVNKPTLNDISPTVPDKSTFKFKKSKRDDVPGVIEVNDCIKQILEKFKDIRFTVNKEGNVTAIISNPPETSSDLTLLRNILEKIQALLDKEKEKNDKTLCGILGLRESLIFSVPGTSASAPFYITNLNNLTSTFSMTTPESNGQEEDPKITSNDAGIAQEYPSSTDETSETLVNLLTRAPIPPNFPEENGFVYLYREPEKEKHTLPPENNCLDNIKIANVESIGTTQKKETVTRKRKKPGDVDLSESIRHRAQLQLDRLTKRRTKKTPVIIRKKTKAPLGPMGPMVTVSSLLTSVNIPTSTVVSSVPEPSKLIDTAPMMSSGSDSWGTLAMAPSTSKHIGVPPLRPFKSIATSVITSMTTIPFSGLSSNRFLPANMATLQPITNNDAISPPKVFRTILFQDDDDETILGD